METPFIVYRMQGWPGKFGIWVFDLENQPGISSHPGAFTDAEMRRHLAMEEIPAHQIEIKMRKAQEAPEINAPPYIVA
ncbi:MAG TPA: hypothetical protein VK752_15500 [Bryobacteraceae bacterium]|jgi:hypothetical protein|nr:hypothetical protein [Bryobacteraceae bacterium]